MKIRQKFIFLMIPLVVLPLFLMTIFALFLFKKSTPILLFQSYETSAVLFLIVVAIASIWVVGKIACSISNPIQALIKILEQYDNDLRDQYVETFDIQELDQLGPPGDVHRGGSIGMWSCFKAFFSKSHQPVSPHECP